MAKINLEFNSYEEMVEFSKMIAAQQIPVPQAPVPQAPVPQAPVPQAPVPQAPIPQAPVNIPTTNVAQSYTQDQIAIAMTGLVDAGKGAVLQGILQQFSAQSLMQINPGQYGEVATKLREAGAAI